MKLTFEQVRQAYIEEMYDLLSDGELVDSDLYSEVAKAYAYENNHIPECYLQLCTAWLER